MSMFRPYDPSMGITQDQYQQQQVAFNKRMYGEDGGLSSLSSRGLVEFPGSAGPMKRLEDYRLEDYRPRQTPWGQKGITKQQWHENNPGVSWFPSEDPNRPRFDFFGDPNFIPEGWPPTGGPNLGTGNGTMLGGPPQGFTPPTGPATMAVVPYINPSTGETWTAPSGGYTAPEGWEVDKQNGSPWSEPDYPQPLVMPDRHTRPPPAPDYPQPPVMPPQPPVIPNWQRRRPGHEIQAELAGKPSIPKPDPSLNPFQPPVQLPEPPSPPVSPRPEPKPGIHFPQLPTGQKVSNFLDPENPGLNPPSIRLKHGGSLTDKVLHILRNLS